MDSYRRFLVKLLNQADSEVARTLRALVDTGNWAGLVTQPSADPNGYDTAEAYLQDAILLAAVKKLQLKVAGVDRRGATLDNFFACEKQCKETNIRLARFIAQTQSLRPCDIAVDDFISRWRKEVKRVLGRASWVLDPRFGPGATLSDKGCLTTKPDKMSSAQTSYRSSAYLYRMTHRGCGFQTHPDDLRIVRGNRFFSVPKDAKKDRGCGLEASVSVSLQLAVGASLKIQYAKRYGHELSSRPLRHQRLARLGSAGRRDLATLDLSNASDTLSYSLVELLVPRDWFELLNSLRAPFTEVDGRWVRLEKFSSMGNGFTFELETIIFRTLCDVITSYHPDTSVFGDDMIVPGEHARSLMAALKFFGFSVNEEKTFCEGPFRESCGGDYFRGRAVRPHFVKELPDEPQQWISLANGLRRADPHLVYSGAAWRFCLDQLPKHVRDCRGPSHLGDVVIHDPSAKPVLREPHKGFGGRTPHWRIYAPVPKTFNLGSHFKPEVAFKAASIGVPERVPVPKRVSGYKIRYTPVWGRNDLWGWLST